MQIDSANPLRMVSHTPLWHQHCVSFILSQCYMYHVLPISVVCTQVVLPTCKSFSSLAGAYARLIPKALTIAEEGEKRVQYIRTTNSICCSRSNSIFPNVVHSILSHSTTSVQYINWNIHNYIVYNSTH